MQVPREDIDARMRRLRRAAIAMSDWAVRAGLKLNKTETKAIVFGGNKFVNKFYSVVMPKTIDLEDGACISFSDTVISVGVVLDPKLSWAAHVNQVTRKFNRVLYAL